MCHNNDFSDKTIAYINKVKEIGKGKKEELDKISLQAYSDYRTGILSDKEYGYIHALLMEYRYPR